MKKIIDELINSSISGVDVYRWKNATWLIFSEQNRWVVELTDEGTLWYNYKFFNDVFKYVSMTVGQEMEDYVIQWANDYFYKDCAHRSIAYPMDKSRNETPKVVEGGIKKTEERGKNSGDEFEWHTRAVINKGIKEVYDSSSTHRQMRAENLIPRIVKDVKPHRVVIPAQGMDRFYYDPDCSANNTEIYRIVEEGIKETIPVKDYFDEFDLNKVIEGGVKI